MGSWVLPLWSGRHGTNTWKTVKLSLVGPARSPILPSLDSDHYQSSPVSSQEKPASDRIRTRGPQPSPNPHVCERERVYVLNRSGRFAWLEHHHRGHPSHLQTIARRRAFCGWCERSVRTDVRVVEWRHQCIDQRAVVSLQRVFPHVPSRRRQASVSLIFYISVLLFNVLYSIF